MFSKDLKIKDLKHNGRGVFHYINDDMPFTFNKLINMDRLQLGFDILHGEKLTNPFVVDMFEGGDGDECLIELGRVINVMFRSKWDKLIDVYENEISLNTYQLLSVNEERITGSNVNTKESLDKIDRLHLTSSFDSSKLENDEKELGEDTSRVTDTGERENIITSTKEVTGNISNRLTDVQKFINILNDGVVNDIIYTDVKEFVGLSIY